MLIFRPLWCLHCITWGFTRVGSFLGPQQSQQYSLRHLPTSIWGHELLRNRRAFGRLVVLGATRPNCHRPQATKWQQANQLAIIMLLASTVMSSLHLRVSRAFGNWRLQTGELELYANCKLSLQTHIHTYTLIQWLPSPLTSQTQTTRTTLSI